jgi:hypothetical protein
MRSHNLKKLLPLILWWFVACACAGNALAKSACENPRLPRPEQPGGCIAAKIDVKDEDGLRSATLVRVYVRSGVSGDVVYPIYAYFLSFAGDDMVDLGDFHQSGSAKTELRLYDALGLKPTWMGGSCCIDQRVFFDRLIEKLDDTYCMTYVLKYPFIGSFRDCDGAGNPGGALRYADGTRRWDDATSLTCARFRRDTGARCEDAGVLDGLGTVTRSDNGAMKYIMFTERPISATEGREYRVYRVDAFAGEAELLEVGEEDPSRKYVSEPHGLFD